MQLKSCNYLNSVFLNTERIVDRICNRIKEKGYQFDSIVFQGMSGALISPILAYKLKKNMVLVRKEDDNSHSYLKIESRADIKSFIIIDDLIASGITMHRIFAQLNNVGISYTQCREIILYNDCGESNRTFFLCNKQQVAVHSFRL